jgi:4-aminobutyrate aminotransferase/(S)-3-amino-2-methylpropionate transaminase
MRPCVIYNRKNNWPAQEPNGIKLVGEHSIFGFIKNDVDVTQNSSQISNFVDLARSKGNYVVDADGNIMLDVAGTELNPLGYNHDLFKNAIAGMDFDQGVINGCASDSISSAGFASLVKETYGPVAPKGLPGITLVNSQNATGAAVKAAMLEREADGWSALYFGGSNHGSPLTLGGMICGWPKASYPSSIAEEGKILEHVRTTVKERRSSGKIVAAIVIEPTQQSTGYTASEDFMNALRSIADDYEAALIIDETSTGCGASG